MNKKNTKIYIQDMIGILKGDLIKLEYLLKHEEDLNYRERVGTKIIKYSEEKLSEIYRLTENL